MKKLLSFLFSIVFFVNLHSQDGCASDFEGTGGWIGQICDLQIDNSSNTANIWQIGEPQKNIFTTANSIPNAIVTDLSNPYPVKNNSSFLITHAAGMGFWMGHTFTLSFDFAVDTDSLNDYGIIEFSPDNGASWCNLMDNTTNCFWWNGGNNPILTGSSNGWSNAEAFLNFDEFNINQGDTVLFKFTFISDNTFDNKDGLMFDNIWISDDHEGIDEYQLMDSKAYPNPASSSMHIEFENAAHASYELSVYDQLGRKIHSASTSQGDITVDLQGFNSGFYQYSLFCPANQKRSTGKFIVH
jgi:hypothetical protein